MRKMIMMTTTMMVMRRTINVMVIMRKALLFNLEASQCSVVASSSNVRLNDRNKSVDDCDDVDYFGDDDDDYDG